MKWKAHLALLTVALIYGANYTIAKNVLDQDYIRPSGFILLRVMAGFVLFHLSGIIMTRESIDRQDVLRLVLCGFTGVAINQLCFFKGLSMTSPIHASLIMVLTPILVLVISTLYLKTKLSLAKIFGVGLGLLGAGMLIIMNQGHLDQMASTLGDLFVLLNATSYGIYLVLVKQLMSKYHPFTVMRWVFSVGLIVVIPFGWSDIQEVDWQDFDMNIWWSIVYVLLCTTYLAYVLNAYALSKVTATAASTYIYLQPLIASGIAIMWYNDQLTGWKLLSAALIFAGVYMASSKRRNRSSIR